MSSNDSIFISAGDPSADFPGKNLITEILKTCPDLDIFGLGGPLMQESGLVPLVSHQKLAVMGFWEVVPRINFFRNLLNRATKEIAARRPRVVVLIDYPGFNLRLAARIKPLGIPIIYYISPQVWAWGKSRIDDIKRLVDYMLVIFPFEEAFYHAHGIAARFTGHPIVDRYRAFPDKTASRAALGVNEDTQLIALLPGSRVQEIKRMLPPMIEAAAIIGRRMEKAVFIVAGVDSLDKQLYADLIGDQSIRILFGRTPDLMNGADFVIVSSGTATIETAYFMTPMVVIYKTGFITYQIARRLVMLDSIGMVNIVAGRKVVPELIQRDAHPIAIARSALDILEDPLRYRQMEDDLKDVRRKLGPGGAAHQAVQAIQEVVTLC